MDRLLSRITPGHVSGAAKVFGLLLAFGLTSAYVTAALTVSTAGIAAFFLAVSLLLAFPGQRSSELLGALAIWMTYGEFMSALQSGQFDLWRWAMALATLAMVVVPLKVQHLRHLARSNPYQPILELDRRTWSGMGLGAAPAPYIPAALGALCIDLAALDAESQATGT